MACAATRPPLREYGWVCDGTDLMVVVEAGLTLPPAVLRADLLGQWEWAGRHGLPVPYPFPGGDHVHAMLIEGLINVRSVIFNGVTKASSAATDELDWIRLSERERIADAVHAELREYGVLP